ncbi:TonB-dependent receptor-like protein [Chitinophaga niastensis]|uniref:TonB-dependent receptor-like protein n=1 Tax=Chitinophaga niastensis TaxID=536980 RepID=A0A2P8HBV9_CHINA|nr:TonB-dependent receptor [Chitinophaga niastensis]PSL43704.1 TonB-dependent receptor-like protein [Chitinophaga niastensis]
MFKRHRSFFLLFFLLCGCIQVQAQRYTVSGYIKDSTNGESMPGATIQILHSTNGVQTNNYGFYSITLPAGNYILLFSFLGYESKALALSLNENISENLELVPHAYQAKEVVITDKRKDANVKSTDMGRVELTSVQVKKLPALMGEVDVLKALQLMPGVQAAGEGNAGFYVRGGGPDQNLILLDEAPVYNTGHLFGFFSVFNADAIKNTTLIKGGMPANYGGRLSSVVDISMKEGNNKNFQGEGGLGAIASRLSFQGPIKKDKASFIVSGRRTYIDLITKPFVNGTSYNGSGYYFYDLNAKMNYIFSDKDRLYLSGYLGKDVFAFNNGDRSFKVKIPWGNTTATLRWNHVFNKKLFANTSLLYNDYRFQFNALQNNFTIGLSSGISDGNAKMDFDYYVNPKHHIKFGGNYIFHTFTPSTVTGHQDSTKFSPENAYKKYAHEVALYLMDDWEISPSFQLNAGIRYSGFMQVGPYTRYQRDAAGNKTDSTVYRRWEPVTYYGGFEPRIILRWAWNDNNSLKASVTRNYQFIHLVTNAGTTLPTDVWVPSTYLVRPQMSWQYSAGYFRNFRDNSYEASAEVYYKDMQHQIEYRQGYTPSLNDPELDFVFGKGQAYGLELFVNKKRGRFTGWVGYTLAWTLRQFPDLNNGKQYPAKYDRRHDLVVVSTYDLNKHWTLSGVFIYGSGNTTTVPERFYFMEGTLVQSYGSINSYRMAAYNRLDLAAIYTRTPKKPNKRIKGSWTFSVYNVYSRKNPYFIYFDQQGNAADGSLTVKAKQVSLFPIIPSVTYNFKF